MSVINTNVSSMQAQSSVRTQGLNLSTAMERLASGVRINSAKDDAAGLAISTRMTASIRGISAAIRNANDGISLTQTAEGSLGQISDNLQRIRELAVQSANTGNSASDRAAMNNEAGQLIAEIDRVAANTTYNGIELLDGTFQAQNLQVGAGSGTNDRIAISIDSASSAALGVGLNSNYTVSVATSISGALAANGLSINAVAVGASASDGVSYADDDASGIAIAAAINAVSGTSGVTATVGETTIAGTTVTGHVTAIASGDVEINGVSIGAIAASTTAAARGGQVAAAVNAVSTQTGVTATFDTTTGAVALNATDGRNISITASNAAGSALVTGLGAGSVTTTAAGIAPTSATAIAADTLSINGVSIGAVAAGSAVTAVTAVTAATESASVVFSAMSSNDTVVLAGLTVTATASMTAAEVAGIFASLTSSSTTGNTQTGATLSGTFTGYTTGIVASGTTVVFTSTTTSSDVTDLADTGVTVGTAAASTVTQGAAAVTAVTGVTALESQAANLATAINLMTNDTGVTASVISGVVTLTSDGSNMELSGFTAAATGLAAPTLSYGTAADTTVTRSSSVTLSSSGSDGITIGDIDGSSATASGLTVGYTAASTSIGTGVSGIDLTTASSSQDALTTLDLAIDTITDSRAAMGAYQNRLTASIANLETTSMNLSASRSRILDTDYAKETTNLAKSQIIQQAATAMLAQANQSGQSVLALLK